MSVNSCSICVNEIPKEKLRVSKNVFVCSRDCKKKFINLLGFSSEKIKVANAIRNKAKEIIDEQQARQWAKLAKSMLTRTW